MSRKFFNLTKLQDKCFNFRIASEQVLLSRFFSSELHSPFFFIFVDFFDDDFSSVKLLVLFVKRQHLWLRGLIIFHVTLKWFSVEFRRELIFPICDEFINFFSTRIENILVGIVVVHLLMWLLMMVFVFVLRFIIRVIMTGGFTSSVII